MTKNKIGALNIITILRPTTRPEYPSTSLQDTNYRLLYWFSIDNRHPLHKMLFMISKLSHNFQKIHLFDLILFVYFLILKLYQFIRVCHKVTHTDISTDNEYQKLTLFHKGKLE